MKNRSLIAFFASSFMLFCSLFATVQAEDAPIVLERAELADDRDVAATLRDGDGDAFEFVVEPYAAIRPDGERPTLYRIHLGSDWTSSHPPVLSVSDPQGLKVTAYVPPDHAGRRYSIYAPDEGSGFTRHALVIALPAHLRANTPIYLRVNAEKPLPRSIQVTDVVSAHVADLARARMDVLFPSVQLAMLMVMLCFFVALRESMYAYYAGHVLFIVIYELYAFGIGYEFPPFNLLAAFGARPLWFAVAITSILLIGFSSRFLDLARSAPRLDRLLAAFRWPFAALAACAAVPALSQGWWVEDALSLLLLFASPLLIVAGVLAWQHGGRRGGYYLCAWIPALMLVMVRVLQLALHWPMPGWLEFALPAGFAYASVVLAFGLADYTLSIRHERDVAHRLAEHDVLTGALNRRAIHARLRSAFVRARESGEALSLLFLDLDHFKQVNDSYGHRAGDQCLRAVIHPIASELRQGDALGRYGGEEFLVVLPGAGAEAAEAVAERIRRHVQEMPVLVSGSRIGLTISVGIASLDDRVQTPDDLIERADAALYQSKSGGRNLVSTHGDAADGADFATQP